MSDHLPARPDASASEGPLSPADYTPPGWEGVPGEPAIPDQGFDWRRYVATVWRYKWLVVLVTALGTAAGFFAANRLIKPEYAAQATIWIEQTSRAEAGRGPIRSSGLLESHAWVDLLKSYVVLDEVVHDLRLYLRTSQPTDSGPLASFALKEQFAPGEYRLEVSGNGATFRLMTGDEQLLQAGTVGDSVGQDLGFAWVPDPDVVKAGQVVAFAVDVPRDVATGLARQIRTRLGSNANFLRVALGGRNPERIARVLNAVTERFVEMAAELKNAKLNELTAILDEQLDYAARHLEEAETGLEDFRVATITLPSEPATPVAPGIDATSGRAFSSFFDLKVEAEQLRRDREALGRVLAIAADSALSVEALQVIPVVSGSSELVGAIGEFTNKRAERRALLYRYTEQHRTVQQLQDEIASLERETIPALVAALIAEVRAREAELQRLIDSAGGELTRIPPRAIDEARLERRVRIATTLFTNLRSRYEEARLAAASSFPDVRILDAAVVPWRPTNAQEKPRLILMAFMASLGFGVLGAVLLDRLDPRVKYPEQLSRELGLPILGTVPHVGRRAYGTGLQNTAQVVEAFRVIRLNLLHAYGTAGPVVITVTSPSPQDGKSFVAANLALAFADLGRRTLVIDGDVRRGSLHRLLGGVRKPGLTDYLAGNATWEQVVHTTAFGSLHRIGCGTRRQDGPELLQSAAMSAFMMQLRANYEAIIVDTPPLEAGVDPLALGTLTGSMLLVVRTGATDRVLIEAKLDALERLPIRILGAVLNDVPPHGVYKQYYRYYVPGYDSWDEEGTPGGQRRIAVTSVSSAAEVEPAATETEPEPDVGAEIFEAAAVDSTRPDPPEGPDNPRCQASPSTMETGSTAAPKPKSKPKSKKSARRRPKSDGSRPKAVSLDPEAQVADAPPRNPRRRRQIEVSEGGKDSAKRRLTEARQQSTAPGNPKHLLDGYRQYQRRNLVRYWK